MQRTTRTSHYLLDRWVQCSRTRLQHQNPTSTAQIHKHLHTTAPIVENEPPIESFPNSEPPHALQPLTNSSPAAEHYHKPISSGQYNPRRAPQPPSSFKHATTPRDPLFLTRSVREQLPLLTSQLPHYAVIHLHGRPYLITVGDTIRLPFLMHGVKPGDVLRLDRATSIGSRDFTLRGGTVNKSFAQRAAEWASPSAVGRPTTVEPIIGKTEDLRLTPDPASSTDGVGQTAGLKKKGPPVYLDDRFFVCRAVVMGTESEPMRVKEKTKRRQRHVKRVRSKHRFTILKVRELRVKGLSEVEALAGRDGD